MKTKSTIKRSCQTSLTPFIWTLPNPNLSLLLTGFLLIFSLSTSSFAQNPFHPDSLRPRPKNQTSSEIKIIGKFSEGLAVALKNGKFGYVNEKKQVVIDFQYSSALDFSEGLAFVVQSENRYFIDKKGKIRLHMNEYSFAMPFQEGLSGVLKINHQNFEQFGGFIDKQGREVIPCQYPGGVASFQEGLAAVGVKGKAFEFLFGFIDKKGGMIIKPQFLDAIAFFEGVAAAQSTNKLWGFIDKKGQWVISPQFEALDINEYFLDGKKVRVKRNNQWIYIDKHGNFQGPA